MILVQEPSINIFTQPISSTDEVLPHADKLIYADLLSKKRIILQSKIADIC